MKTQIITLESHDDLISIRDRMSWAKTPRILLVWPAYEQVALRQVDLKILQRHASSLGAQLGIVTRTRKVKEDAEALNIPVFETPNDAQKVEWLPFAKNKLPRRAPRRDLRQQREQVQVKEEAWRSQPLIRVIFFTLGVLSVLVIASIFIPRAQITLHPDSIVQVVTLPVAANPKATDVIITGVIPAHVISVIESGSQTINVTGESAVPLAKAKGVAQFKNLTQQQVKIPSGTIIRTVGAVRFATTEDGFVEAGVGKTVDLSIEALEAGLAGNLDPDTITAIEGSLGLSLTVTNPEPTTGGREKPSVTASQVDRDRVKNQLLALLNQQALNEIRNKTASDDMLFENTLNVSQTLDETYDPPEGSAGVTLTLTMRMEYSAYYASASDLNKLALLAMNASLPPGFSPASDDLTLEPFGTRSTDADGVTRWNMRAQRKLIQQVDDATVFSLVQGKTQSSASARLDDNLPLIEPAQVKVSPSWWPWLPLLPFRIEVVTR